MNQQQPPSQFQMFGGQPQAAGAASRFMPYLRGMVGGGLVIGAAFMGSMVVAPAGWSLPEIAGRAFGAAAKWEVWTSTEATVERERRVAEAVAKAQADAQEKLQIAVIRETYAAQAKMQIDVENSRQALEAATQSNSFNSIMAGLADAACVGSQVVRGAGVQNTGRDLQDGAQVMAGITCGLGSLIRDDITRSQNRAVVAATTARGLPQATPTRPATQQIMAPQPRTVPAPSAPVQIILAPPPNRLTEQALREVYAITQPTRYHSMDETAQASKDLSRFSPTINTNVRAGMEGWSIDRSRGVFTERVQALVALASK